MDEANCIPDDAESFYKAAFHQLISEAKKERLVITVSQKPLEPLAMGHYETVVEVRKEINYGS